MPSTRRDFLASGGLALGALALPRLARALDAAERGGGAGGGAPAPEGRLLYVGTYTENGRREGIYLVRFDPQTGALRQTGAVDAGPNPSFLALSANGRALYAVNEVGELGGRLSGGVTALVAAAGTGALTTVNQQASEGKDPCYVSLDARGRFALVANYSSGTVALLPLGKGGALEATTAVVQQEGTGPNAERQEGPHAHCILPDPSGTWALSANLGADRVFVYRIGADGRSLAKAGELALPAGAGPRHLAFHPNRKVVFVSCELDSTVHALSFDEGSGKLASLASASTLPEGWSGQNFPADVHVSPNGRTVYVSNRGHNSIAALTVNEKTGAMTLAQVTSTEGDWPRNFAIDPSGKWLLVANQKSGDVFVFPLDAAGKLGASVAKLEIPAPVCLRFA